MKVPSLIVERTAIKNEVHPSKKWKKAPILFSIYDEDDKFLAHASDIDLAFNVKEAIRQNGLLCYITIGIDHIEFGSYGNMQPRLVELSSNKTRTRNY
jgi:hypothetical protein